MNILLVGRGTVLVVAGGVVAVVLVLVVVGAVNLRYSVSPPLIIRVVEDVVLPVVAVAGVEAVDVVVAGVVVDVVVGVDDVVVDDVGAVAEVDVVPVAGVVLVLAPLVDPVVVEGVLLDVVPEELLELDVLPVAVAADAPPINNKPEHMMASARAATDLVLINIFSPETFSN